jgi:hypothetical protein
LVGPPASVDEDEALAGSRKCDTAHIHARGGNPLGVVAPAGVIGKHGR